MDCSIFITERFSALTELVGQAEDLRFGLLWKNRTTRWLAAGTVPDPIAEAPPKTYADALLPSPALTGSGWSCRTA